MNPKPKTILNPKARNPNGILCDCRVAGDFGGFRNAEGLGIRGGWGSELGLQGLKVGDRGMDAESTEIFLGLGP